MFIGASKILSGYDYSHDLEATQADGAVFGIIPSSQEELDSVRKLLAGKCEKEDRILFVLPNAFNKIADIAYEYAAVLKLKSLVQDDDILSDEYDVYIEDLGEVVGNYINSFIRPELQKAEYIHLGKKVGLKRKAQLSALLSDICDKAFPYTPIINNESINKNNLPAVAINSRGKILNGILSSPLEKNLGLVGSGQDVSIMRSTLIRTGILSDADANPIFNKSTQDENINRVLSAIRDFFDNTAKKDESNFGELYSVLTEPAYGIGLKKGLIPIFLAVVIREVRESITILYNKKELRLSTDLLDDINLFPEKYSVRIDEWSAEKEDYINGLIDIFSAYIPDKNYSFNNLAFVVSAISRWYLSLPKYAKDMTEIYCGNIDRSFKSVSKSKRQFINALKQVELNPREFLFSGIFKIFGMSEFSLDILDNIKGIKEEYDDALNNLISVLISDIKAIFGADNTKATLSSVLKDWCDGLNSEVYNRKLFL